MSEPEFVLEQYEALRHEALATESLGLRGQGLAVFLSRGLPGWLAVLTALAPRPRPEPPTAETLGTERPRLVVSVRKELTTVVAGMVLACVSKSREVECSLQAR